MSYINGFYTNEISSPVVNTGYVNKFEKSLKLPFFNVLYNNMPSSKFAVIDESETDASEVAVSDIVELSSAVVGASNVSDTDTGDATYA